jgi:hypothetical protein
MSFRLSTRISIKWGDEAPSEPTDTLVLTVGSYYMDMRIKKSDKGIDWAFAGTKEITSQSPSTYYQPAPNGTSYSQRHALVRCRWHHVIDSRGSSDVDEGVSEDLPNGDELERGSMASPEHGNKVLPYEEVWRMLQPTSRDGFAWILQGQIGDCTRFLGKGGGHFLAMEQSSNGHFHLRREVLEGSQGQNGWAVKYNIDGDTLPSPGRMGPSWYEGESTWTVGDVITVEGMTYHVRSVCSLTPSR